MIVYHYTSINVLDKILNSYTQDKKTINLRATYSNCLNDRYENIIGENLIQQMISEIENELNIPILYRIDGLFHNKQYMTMIINEIKENEKHIKEKLYNVVTSFSKSKDIAPMWLMYGDKGHGISLGFDTNNLCEHLYNNNKINIINRDCIYLTKRQLELNTVNKHSDAYRYIKWLYEKITAPQGLSSMYNINQNLLKIKTTIVTNLIYFLSQYYKLYEWNVEEEYRIAFGEYPIFMKMNENNTLYTNIPININRLKEIIIGPKCTIEEENKIYKLFHKYNLTNLLEQIEKSQSSLQ